MCIHCNAESTRRWCNALLFCSFYAFADKICRKRRVHCEDICVLSLSQRKAFELNHLNIRDYFPSGLGNQVDTASSLQLTAFVSCFLIHYDRDGLWVSMTQCPAAELLGVPLWNSGTRGICISSYCYVHTLHTLLRVTHSAHLPF